mmetsp:Transcript_218/g.273  ORF Transcript_218/g.273 Transcript_218/m.273 type:complete len:153 (+) Transcript_218:72-530(+)
MMKTTSILRNQNALTQHQNRSVRFNKGIDFAVEEKKSLNRLKIIKEAREKKMDAEEGKRCLYRQLQAPEYAQTFQLWYLDFATFRLNADQFFQSAGVRQNNFRANLDALRAIPFENLPAVAAAWLNVLVGILKRESTWSRSKAVTPGISPNN